MSTLTFKKFSITDFQGIEKTNPIVIDFSEFYPKGKRIAKATGDQGAGKSSFIHALLYSLGYQFEFKIESFVNIQDNAMAGEFEFEKDGKNYQVKFTKSKFTLSRLFRDGEEERWIPESEPKTLVAKLIGHVATSPMFLKESKGEDQVKWLYSVLSVPKETLVEETKLKNSLTEAVDGRKESNKNYERLKAVLSEEPMYQRWSENETKYAETKSIEEVKTKFDEIKKQKFQYDTAIVRLAGVEDSLVEYEKTIAEVQEQMNQLQEKLNQLDAQKIELRHRKKVAEEWIASKKPILSEYEVAEKEYMNISTYLLEQQQWQSVKTRKSEMDEFETLVQQFDTRKDEIRQSIRDLVKKIVPDMPGLEVVTEDSIDTQNKPKGIYIDGKTPAQISESELFDFYFRVCMSQGVTLLVIENINVLGSNAIETLNKMAKQNISIFATEQRRGQKALKIEFVDAIR